MNAGAALPYALVEDDAVEDLRPLVDCRAAHRLLAGAFRLWDRVRALADRDAAAIVVRPAFAAREREISALPVVTSIAELHRAFAASGATRVVLILSRAVPLHPLSAFLAGESECA